MALATHTLLGLKSMPRFVKDRNLQRLYRIVMGLIAGLSLVGTAHGATSFSHEMVARSDNFELRVIHEPSNQQHAFQRPGLTLNVAQFSPAVYVLQPGSGNVDYFNYFSQGEKFDVRAFHIHNFADLKSQIVEGQQALKQGNNTAEQDGIRFTLQTEQGQVTVMIQHSDSGLSADNFVFAAPKTYSRVAGSP